MAHAQGSLKYAIKSGHVHGYTIETSEVVSAADGKVTESKNQKLPIKMRMISQTQVEVVSGPIFTRGRSIGRARTKVSTLSSSQVPAPYFVCLPPGGVKVGQTWKAPFFAAPPLPAGIHATYKFVKLSPDKRAAMIQMSVSNKSGAEMSGSGMLLVELSTGFLTSGKANFTITYSRPDPKDPKKVSVNSRTKIATIIHKS